ncbi:hypothetical protein GJAV_G00052780 [Gymnothorax javanicus]|nr:hypothetical protein GJAV_G00052780 [Gymnothorax javanicus]
MASQMNYGSSMFQSMDDDLNASLAAADELSEEFNSLMQQCSSTTEEPETPARSTSFHGTPQQTATATFPSYPDNQGSTDSVPSLYISAPYVSEPSPSPVESMTSGNKYSPGEISSSQTRRGRITYAYRSESDSAVPYGLLAPPNQSSHAQRHASPSRLNAHNGSHQRHRSPSPQPRGFNQSPHLAHLPVPTVHSPCESGRRSPRMDRSPSPGRHPRPTSNTLPRNFVPFKTHNEGAQRPKIPSTWNESDLDVAYERKPHHTYDETKWLRPAVPSSSWRESNLDAPAPPSRKQHQSHPSQNANIMSPASASYSSQPIISRISIPPSSPQIHERRPIPLSVIMRLQNPQYFATAYPHSPVPEESAAPYRQPMFLHHEYLPQQPPPELGQPGVYGEALIPADVEAELERIETAHGQLVPEAVQERRAGDPAPVPRPLSPTRLQPVVAPEIEVAPDRQELLRLRAEIPRALKRRGSIDPARPPAKGQYRQMISKLFRRKEIRHRGERASSSSSSSSEEEDTPTQPCVPTVPTPPAPAVPQQRGIDSILRKHSKDRRSSGRRAHLSPLVLLLDGALVGELETVKRAAQEMSDPSQANDEGITALHNAICGMHYPIVDFLVQIGANVSAPDSHGWTPLHCAASCNDQKLCEYLVYNGAAVMAVTESDGATASQKCDPYAMGFQECESFLRGVEEAMGVHNSGVLYALWTFPAQAPDELSFREGDMVTILDKPQGSDWWLASLCGREGFVPNNYFGLFPKVRPKSLC